MRKILFILALAIFAFTTSACSSVDPGYVGVKVNKWGGDKGVEDTPLPTGRYWVGLTWSIYSYPVFQQNEQWSQSPHEGKKQDQSITFQSREGMALNADVGCVYTLEHSMVPKLFQRFRLGIDEISDGYLRQLVRDTMNREASKLPIETLYGEGRSAFITAVQTSVASEVAPMGIVLHNLTIGTLRLPQAIVSAMDAKIAATQSAMKVENQLRETSAQAKKAVVEAEGEAQALIISAKARAESNRLISASLTPLLIERARIEKWDGALPHYQGGGSPIINMGSGK